jgi:hypothetical protein
MENGTMLPIARNVVNQGLKKKAKTIHKSIRKVWKELEQKQEKKYSVNMVCLFVVIG